MALGARVPRIEDRNNRRPVRTEAARLPAIRKVALLGFGTVGRAVAELLCRGPQNHVRLTHVFNRDIDRKRVAWPDGVQWTDNFREVVTSEADIVVEAMGGLEPAREYIQRALQAGKSVVTANKHVMAKHGPELLSLARHNGVQLEYGASVGGAVPVLAALRYGLAGDRLLRVCGVLNGTCNFILSNMAAKGTSLAAALAEAQRLGFAESDPCDDVNGVDAACKLAIVARLGLRAELNAFEIPTQSIASINPDDFRYAHQLGCTIRQISLAELDGDRLRAAVGPALIPLKSPLAACVDNQNTVVITGEQSGETVLAGRGAGGHPTAVAVVSDLLAIAQAEPSSVNHRFIPTYTPEPMNCRHYVRVTGNKAELICCATSILDKRGLHRETSLECSHGQSAAFVLQSCSSRIAQNAVKQIADMAGEQGSAVCLPLIDSA